MGITRFDIECLSGDGSKVILTTDADDTDHFGLHTVVGNNMHYIMLDVQKAKELSDALLRLIESSYLKNN